MPTPLSTSRFWMCVGAATLVLLATPARAGKGGGSGGHAEANAGKAAPLLPYGAGYEQRLRAARSLTQGSSTVQAPGQGPKGAATGADTGPDFGRGGAASNGGGGADGSGGGSSNGR